MEPIKNYINMELMLKLSLELNLAHLRSKSEIRLLQTLKELTISLSSQMTFLVMRNNMHRKMRCNDEKQNSALRR